MDELGVGGALRGVMYRTSLFPQNFIEAASRRASGSGVRHKSDLMTQITQEVSAKADAAAQFQLMLNQAIGTQCRGKLPLSAALTAT